MMKKETVLVGGEPYPSQQKGLAIKDKVIGDGKPHLSFH